MLLEDKTAIVYGAGGQVGGAVARAFAAEGATVHLTGRTLASLEVVAAAIEAAGGRAHVAAVDALDEAAVDAHADAVAAAGGIDISCNVISTGDIQGTPLVEMAFEDFVQPIQNRVRTQFLTSRAAARHMVRQGGGVILSFGGAGGRDPLRDYCSGGYQVSLGGTQVAFGAIDVFRRQLANELGPHGVRVLTIESSGVAETLAGDFAAPVAESLARNAMLKRSETLEDIGNVAAFVASDKAKAMTGTTVNITCGREVD